MGRPNVRIMNALQNIVPTEGASDRAIVVGAAATGLGTFDDNTRYVLYSLDTAPARVTFNGDAATGAVGHSLAIGSSGTWSKRTAESVSIIRVGGANGNLHLSQFTDA